MFFGDLAPTGFGTVTMDLGRALLDLGHDVRFVSQNEVGDLEEPFASRTFAVNDPALLDPAKVAAFGADSLSLTTLGVAGIIDGTLWADGWKAEAGVMLGDFTAARMMVMADDRTREAFRSVPFFHYVPIEGVDLPLSWAALWHVVHPVAMSEFGADQIARVTGKRPVVVYHGVDTDLFHPIRDKPLHLGERTLLDKGMAKAFFGGKPDARWLFRCDRFMPRKRYASMLRAIAPVLVDRPDVFMVIHCRAFDQGGNLRDLISKYPPRIAKRIILTGLVEDYGMVPRDLLVALYNAADVYLSTSAEGFGLTIAEAMACGVPVVGMAYSAVPEVIGPGGLLAPVATLIDNEYDHAWAVVDEAAFGAQVATLLDDPALRRRLGAAAREHVVKSFSWATAALQFSGLIREATA
jgi:glycosyltransferase involved in cell wall biosynthesis